VLNICTGNRKKSSEKETFASSETRLEIFLIFQCSLLSARFVKFDFPSVLTHLRRYEDVRGFFSMNLSLIVDFRMFFSIKIDFFKKGCKIILFNFLPKFIFLKVNLLILFPRAQKKENWVYYRHPRYENNFSTHQNNFYLFLSAIFANHKINKLTFHYKLKTQFFISLWNQLKKSLVHKKCTALVEWTEQKKESFVTKLKNFLYSRSCYIYIFFFSVYFHA
jgi:hypothetical protein